MTSTNRQSANPDGHLARPRVVLAAAEETPEELLLAAEAALLAVDVELTVVATQRSGVLGRAIAALGGEVLARRLERELVGPPLCDVAVALDLTAATALARERTRGMPVPVIAVCGELAPRPGWAAHLDRLLALDDEAAVALADLGVDGARIAVLGAPVGRAWIDVAERPRAELRRELGLAETGTVVTIDCASLGGDRLSQLLIQLAMVEVQPRFMFDAGGQSDVANQLRRQVPGLGLTGKLINDLARVPAAWRAAEVILGRGPLASRLRALAVGAGIIMIDAPAGDLGEGQALAERGAGLTVPLLAASSVLGDAPRLAALARSAAQLGGVVEGGDPLARLAELCLEVTRDRQAILAEPFADPAPAAVPASRPRAASFPPGLEDLGGPLPAAAPPRPPRDLEADIARMKDVAAKKQATVDDALAALKARMKAEPPKK
jgi:hypothetical protein